MESELTSKVVERRGWVVVVVCVCVCECVGVTREVVVGVGGGITPATGLRSRNR